MGRRMVRCLPVALALWCIGAASAQAATFSQTQTLPVPPASNFAGSAGGDGWDLSFSDDKVFNVFHHGTMVVACHLQSTAANCWPASRTITGPSGATYLTPNHSATRFDPATGRLYAYVTRTVDMTAGVVCVDTVLAATTPNPFCGFTALTAANASSNNTSPAVSRGSRWYSFNYVAGAPGVGGQNRLLCFDVATQAACTGQPYAVDIGVGSVNADLAGSISLIGDRIYVPVFFGSTERVACLRADTHAGCGGAWPATYAGYTILAPYPLMSSTGTLLGVCLPVSTHPCYTLAGASTPTPAGQATALGSSGGAFHNRSIVLGTRVYTPFTDGGFTNRVHCFDYSTSAACPNFPKVIPTSLEHLYTINPDPQRPTCIWVMGHGGAAQIQNFDAYTGGACGAGATRVLTEQFIVPIEQCYPTTYESLQLVFPIRSAYTSGTVEFANAGGNPIPGLPAQALDANGQVNLSGLGLETQNGLPQFLITLVGAGSPGQLQVKLTWTDAYDPACVEEGTEVTKENTSATTSLSGGGKTGTSITVPPGTSVHDTSTLAGTNATGATGTMTYTWYADDACTVVQAGQAPKSIITPGTMPDSDPVTLPSGTYYPRAFYSGDAGNNASASSCGGEVLRVAVNDPPTAAFSRSSWTWTQGSGPIPIDTGITVGDTDSSSLSATLTLIGGQAGDTLAGDGAFNGTTLSISSRSISALQTALRAVTFQTTGGTGDRTIRLVVSDGSATSTPRDQVVTVIDVNDPPVVRVPPVGEVQVGEAVTLTVEATDPEGDAIVLYRWDVDGDGTVDAQTTVPFLVWHYIRPGATRVIVTATDEFGNVGTGEGAIRVVGSACTRIGTNGADSFNGAAGNDVLCGLGGPDTIKGGYGNDVIVGGGGNDTLDGGYGDDTVNGSTGNDTVDGGYGDDILIGGPGVDTLTGGYGNDLLDALDGTRDTMADCGSNTDTLIADAVDPRKACETSRTARTAVKKAKAKKKATVKKKGTKKTRTR